MSKVKIEFQVEVDQVQPLIACAITLDAGLEEIESQSPEETVIITEIGFILDKVLEMAAWYQPLCETDGNPLGGAGKAAIAAWKQSLDEAASKMNFEEI